MLSATPEIAPDKALLSRSSVSRRFAAIVLVLAALVGADVAWHGGDLFMYDDLVSYLDVASAWLRHDWRSIANAYWSPGYSWFLAAALAIVRPSGFWEPVVVRSVSFILYAIALLCFALFWQELTRHMSREAAAEGLGPEIGGRAWFVFGIVLFLYGAMLMIGPYRDSPDMTVAAIVFLACAALVRIRSGKDPWALYLGFGVLLALGYYMKAVMFPMSFVFLAAAALAARNKKQALPRLAAAMVIFLIACSPWVFVLSRAKGRLTFGDSGRLNYLWYNDLGWSGDGYPFPWNAAVAGTPQHPMRQLLASPRVYEFSAPFQGSYPPWDDPSYWYDGAKVRFNLPLQIRRLFSAAQSYAHILDGQTALIAGALFLFFLLPAWKLAAGKLPWYLLIPGLAGLALYAPIRADNRYVAPFFVLIWSALFAGLYVLNLKKREQFLAPLALGVAIALLLPIGLLTVSDAVQAMGRWRAGAAFDHSDARVADYLHSMGVEPRDRLGYIQSPEDTFNKYWARLAKVTIVADMPYQDAEEFWHSDAALQHEMVEVFCGAGVKAIVAYKVPKDVRTAGWQKAGRTDYYVLPCSGAPPTP
jgi:4-amino-4-deoxy-L-arabinose transferase-like glycosyltransferase